PRRPEVYGALLRDKIAQHGATCWLVNTGWTGGAYGTGQRIELSYTRALINAALSGELDKVEFERFHLFNLQIPKACPDVPNAILNPRENWLNENEYDQQAEQLAERFNKNLEQYKEGLSKEIIAAGPSLKLA
ncbi:MAG: phosphoenolpyruvate carboxykinase (ATP), partial [Bacteroidota bacterium]